MLHFKDITTKDMIIIGLMYAAVTAITWVAIDIHYTAIINTVSQ